MISKTIDIVVTSVLQTTAGKMIFGRHIEQGMAAAPAAPVVERDKTNVAGTRPRPGRRFEPATADVVVHPSVPLVADRFLSDSRHRGLHHQCSGRRRSCRVCSTGVATSRTGARGPGRG